MTPESREIVQAIGCEVLARQAASLPPPCDLDAERLVVAGLFVGVCPEDVLLEREHFFAPLLGAVYKLGRLLRAEGMTVAIEPILTALRDQEWVGPIERELLRLRDEIPSVSRATLEDAAQIVYEMAERRRLLRACESLAARLRGGELDAIDAGRELAEVVSVA
jgi:replicative DNA helicase